MQVSYRYLGNKSKLADWIVGKISDVIPKGASIADPMCGTASVSAALAQAGYSVIAADALKFPVMHARARLLAKKPPLFLSLGGYKGVLEWLNTTKPCEGYFFNEFGASGKPANGRAPRLYFSTHNAAHIDGIREGIRCLVTNGDIDEIEHSVLIHHLILATNKVANITGTYGYFRSALSQQALRPLSFEPLTFINTKENHTIIQSPVEKLAPNLFTDAVYLDPPYTKRQYAGNYHILETLAQEDEPEAVGDGGLRPWSDQASDFCYRRSAGKAFRKTLEQLKVPHVFISYSEDGQVEENELISILSDFGIVTVYEQPYVRYQSNGKAKGGSVVERLYHIKVE